MKRTISALILALPLMAAAQEAPDESVLSELFSKREALRVQTEIAERAAQFGIVQRLVRIQEAVEATADALIAIQAKLEEQAAASQLLALNQAATAAEMVALKAKLEARRAAAQITLDAVTKATTILGVRAALTPYFANEVKP
jgi:enoyl-CoA hydratase/carnithine racemase